MSPSADPTVASSSLDGSERLDSSVFIEGADISGEPPPRFGVLRKVPAIQGWKHEAHDFTPWLAENLDLLGQELGLVLTLRAREHAVGKYWLDLLLEDTEQRVVIVENQFGATDHDHLGKLLTYCAGADASVVIWIAERLHDEHLAALEWLNEHTLAGVGFFGVELELLCIGDSLPAPHFRVRVEPNDWQKAVRSSSEPRTEWTWEMYRDQLRIPQERLDVGKALVNAVEQALDARALAWSPRMRKGYIAFQRAGGYNALIIDLWWNHPPRLAIKLPGAPEDLGLGNPYPDLETLWTGAEREYGWVMPTLIGLPNVGLAIDLALPYHAISGPMAQVGGPVDRP